MRKVILRQRFVVLLASLAAVPSFVVGQSFESTPPPSGLDLLSASAIPDGEPFREPDVVLDRFGARFTLFSQQGQGLQSQASNNPQGPGSEAVTIFNPIFYAHLKQRGGITHDVYIPVDIVTAVSTDALDAVATASRENEAFAADIMTTVEDGPDQRLLLHWGAHVEEEMRAVRLGFGISNDFADDNAMLTVMFDAVGDVLEPDQPNGYDPGLESRFTFGANITFTQILSETTTMLASYGVTGQSGHIHTPWNSIPMEAGGRIADYWPKTRVRHAASLRLAQGIPATRTFANAGYRFYFDDYGATAHSADVTLTQYVTDDFWVRANYRYHSQGAPVFWQSLFPATSDPQYGYRTADSDLATLDLHEVGGSMRWFYDRRGAPTIDTSWFEVNYVYYGRSNSLEVHVASLGFGTHID
jgi:hypothetical protein